jgi:Flp pilus assembly protein TadG
MAAKSSLGRSGQSLLEFVLILPVMAGLLFMMVRVSAAIQVSIVNQKYSRQRVFELAENGAYYPRLGRFRNDFVPKLANRMVIGVSEESTASGQADVRSAPSQPITSKKQGQGSNENQAEPDSRSLVRVRNTVELCTPVRVASIGGSGGSELTPEKIQEGKFTSVSYCRSDQ